MSQGRDHAGQQAKDHGAVVAVGQAVIAVKARAKEGNRQPKQHGYAAQAQPRPEIQHDVVRMRQVEFIGRLRLHVAGAVSIQKVVQADAGQRMVGDHFDGRLPQLDAEESRALRQIESVGKALGAGERQQRHG